MMTKKLEFGEIRKNLKFERLDMSSLGIFQNGNGSIFEIFSTLEGQL